jgi:hypothetical protein
MGTNGSSASRLPPAMVGRLRKTCSPSRSQRTLVQSATESATQLISRFAGADSLGLEPDDYDAEQLDRLARGFGPLRADVPRLQPRVSG